MQIIHKNKHKNMKRCLILHYRTLKNTVQQLAYKGEEVGEGRAEGLSAKGNSGNAATAFVLDVDDTVLVPSWIQFYLLP